MNIGNALQKLRKHKRINQQVIASFLNMDRSTYARLEENQTQLTFPLADKVASFYGMELEYFVLCLKHQHYLHNSTTLRLVNLQKAKEKGDCLVQSFI